MTEQRVSIREYFQGRQEQGQSWDSEVTSWGLQQRLRGDVENSERFAVIAQVSASGGCCGFGSDAGGS